MLEDPTFEGHMMPNNLSNKNLDNVLEYDTSVEDRLWNRPFSHISDLPDLDLGLGHNCNGSGRASDRRGRLLHQVYYHDLKTNSTDQCTYRSLSSELLNCKITDTLNNITHQEGKVNLNDLLKTIR